MSRSRNLQLRMDRLNDLRILMNAMKNMALIEVRRLSSRQRPQAEMVLAVEHAGRDFLGFFSEPAIPAADFAEITVLIGSERGFCGDFNRVLADCLPAGAAGGVIAVGSRLGSHLQERGRAWATLLAGAGTAAEIPAVLQRLIEAINLHIQRHQLSGACRLTVILHDESDTDRSDTVSRLQILPPFTPRSSGHAAPPLLNVEPAIFFADLIEHYLMAVFQQQLTASLLAENQSRLRHLEAAAGHLQNLAEALQRKLRQCRQEEITEEIEVLLLNAAKEP